MELQNTRIPDLRPLGIKDGKFSLSPKNDTQKRPMTAQVCRICLSEDETEQNNPLLSICKCAGSMSMIHVRCINDWLN